MRVICAWCDENLGEKCPFCGSTDVALGVGSNFWVCLNCPQGFFTGQGGVTHGICLPCRDEYFPPKGKVAVLSEAKHAS